MDKIKLIKPLSEEELKVNLLNYKNGDKNSKEIIVTHNIRLVFHIVKKYKNTNYDMDELCSIGFVGLMKAIDSFDLSKGYTFSTYAARCIHNEILMFLRKSRKEYVMVSLNEPIDIDNKNTLEDLLVDTDKNIEEDYEKNESIEEIRRIVYQLPEKEREIICLFFGFYNNRCYSQREIGKLFHVSQGYISRVLNKTLMKIKLEYEMGTIKYNEVFKTKKIEKR